MEGVVEATVGTARADVLLVDNEKRPIAAIEIFDTHAVEEATANVYAAVSVACIELNAWTVLRAFDNMPVDATLTSRRVGAIAPDSRDGEVGCSFSVEMSPAHESTPDVDGAAEPAERYHRLVEKSRILAEIRRLAAENDGVPPGQKKFGKETGLSTSAWCGKYWRQWSHALEEAGFSANKRSEPIDRDVLVVHLAALMRKLGRVPSVADMRLARRSDTTFPHLNTFQKLGSAPTRLALLRAYVEASREDVDLLALLPARGADEPEPADSSNGVDGTVYMFRHGKNGKHYKIGHTYDVPRRHREIKLELPEELVHVHAIRTDDPSGIEAYWKRRFAAKRTNGEWFTLSPEDIAAFKRRKFM